MKISNTGAPFKERRDFLKKASLGAGLMAFPGILSATESEKKAPNSRLNLAFVGVGGKGGSAILGLKDETIVAFCDVDDRRVAQSRASSAPLDTVLKESTDAGAKWFKDYREMLVSMGSEIDGVVISTPDHMHFPIALSAINMGKHVYCEKPLTHTIEEARILAAAAAKAGVVTQMGNQGHSNAGTRLVKEWVDAGVIGEIKEIHSWTNRPIWPQGLPMPDHSERIPVVPKGLSWDLWLGVAEQRPFDPVYLPFSWRGWWDFGSGAFGDMACHIMDAAYWALQLDDPEWIEASSTPVSAHACPNSSIVTYKFPKRGKFSSVKYKWYDGGLRPALPAGLSEFPEGMSGNGTFIVGSEAIIASDTYAGSVRILPDDKFNQLKPILPPKTLPRVKGSHYSEWTNAIRENRKADSDFSYAGPFTEMVALGNVALRAGTRIEYDGKKMEITNLPEANKFLKKDYQPGWIL